MSLRHRLTHTTAALSRQALGVALGVGLAFNLLAGAPDAFAQAVVEAPVVQPAAGEGPALWAITDGDSTLYLFGTVHVLRPETAWGSPKVDAAFDASENVIFEISNPDDQAAVVPLIQQYGVSPEHPLSSILTPEEIAHLDTAAQSMGATAAQMDPMRPWLVGLTLSMAPLIKAGYDPQSGVELILKRRAEAAGKPIAGLETIDSQVRILAGLSEDTQLAFLRSTLKDFDEATSELDGLVAAWAIGDMDTIDRTMVREMRDESEEIYQALLVRRNTDWADQIEELLEGSGTTFIAVGSAHLAGSDSVQALLEARGVTVTRR